MARTTNANVFSDFLATRRGRDEYVGTYFGHSENVELSRANLAQWCVPGVHGVIYARRLRLERCRRK
jgi:hypothetical protein